MNNSDLTPEIEYPVRINRYLYLKGYCSRRRADDFIASGKVLVNGKPAVLGQKITATDSVTVGKAVKKLQDNYIYYAFNKPVGIVTHNPQQDEQGVEDIFRPASRATAPHARVSAVGRLDKNSRGLLLLTNDGRIVDRLLSPKFEHEKEYVVEVNKKLSPRVARQMERGVTIEGYRTKPAKVDILDDHRFRIILTEGKKHQIRRMVTALGYEVVDLERVRIMNIWLRDLKPGTARAIEGEELENLLKKVGPAESRSTATRRSRKD
jgi:23S rRNA pseudouridine2604 synthase